MKIIYKNLSNCIGERMMYIRSTDVEQKRWDKLLLSYPDEALYFMTKGHTIVIEDKSTHRKGKIQRIFCPVMTDFLRFLKGYKQQNTNIKEHFFEAVFQYQNNKIIHSKYKLYRNKLKNCHVRGRTIRVKKECSFLY